MADVFASVDLRTLFRLMFLADVIVCTLLLAYDKRPAGRPSIYGFVCARMLHAAACLFISFRGQAPMWFTPYLSNSLLFLGLGLEMATVARVRGGGRLLTALPLGIALIAIIAFVGFARSADGFVGVASSSIALLFATGTVALLAGPGRTRLVMIMVGMYAAVALSSVARAYAGLVEGQSVENQTFLQMTALIVSYVYCVGGGFGFLLMLREEEDRKLRHHARTDSLTGLLNHRTFFDSVRDRLQSPRQDDLALSLLFVDVDHFKAVNDTYGHPAGDVVLQGIARSLRTELPPNVLVGRIGGEEFAVLLPCGRAEAQATAERLRRAAAELRLPDLPDLTCTVSIGGATAAPHPRGPLSLLVRRCDRALYDAKEGGRNRIVFAVAEEPAPGEEAGDPRAADRTANRTVQRIADPAAIAEPRGTL